MSGACPAKSTDFSASYLPTNPMPANGATVTNPWATMVSFDSSGGFNADGRGAPRGADVHKAQGTACVRAHRSRG
jgi:hypothetical protein